MVGNREELLNKMVEEIQRETDIELAHAAHLARGVREERGITACRMTRLCWKMNLGVALLRGDSIRSSIHGTPADQDQLWNWSRSIRDEFSWIE
jgi:hypothetical protein